MGTWPEAYAGCDIVIHTASLEAVGLDLANTTTNNFGVTIMPAGNHAVFIPFRLGSPMLVKIVSWWNGSNLTGNLDFGVYDLAGRRLFSIGNTNQSGSGIIQSVSLGTPYYLSPGGYYMAFVVNSSLAPTVTMITVDEKYLAASGVFQANLGSTVLPATVTYASFTDTGRIPLIAISGTTVWPVA